MCADCENDKRRLISHSSFVYVLYVIFPTVDGNLIVRNMLLTYGILKMVSNVCREVDEVREERLRWRRGYDRLRREETNEERLARLVNLSCRLHSLIMALHTDWLGEEWMIAARRITQRAKGAVSPLMSVVAITLQYGYNTLITQSI